MLMLSGDDVQRASESYLSLTLRFKHSKSLPKEKFHSEVIFILYFQPLITKKKKKSTNESGDDSLLSYT